jgi:hypothetical protein
MSTSTWQEVDNSVSYCLGKPGDRQRLSECRSYRHPEPCPLPRHPGTAFSGTAMSSCKVGGQIVEGEGTLFITQDLIRSQVSDKKTSDSRLQRGSRATSRATTFLTTVQSGSCKRKMIPRREGLFGRRTRFAYRSLDIATWHNHRYALILHYQCKGRHERGVAFFYPSPVNRRLVVGQKIFGNGLSGRGGGRVTLVSVTVEWMTSTFSRLYTFIASSRASTPDRGVTTCSNPLSSWLVRGEAICHTMN